MLYETRHFADIIKKIEGTMFITMIKDKEKDKQKAKNALRNILEMEKRLPEDFAPEKELQEARMDKYCNENSDDYKKSRIKVIQPDEFLKLL